jgi:signal transduction histidine kinase
MSEHVINNISDGIRSNKKSGNGLGLSHAINCIKEWGGEYHLHSKENVGTIFSIMLNIS